MYIYMYICLYIHIFMYIYIHRYMLRGAGAFGYRVTWGWDGAPMPGVGLVSSRRPSCCLANVPVADGTCAKFP